MSKDYQILSPRNIYNVFRRCELPEELWGSIYKWDEELLKSGIMMLDIMALNDELFSYFREDENKVSLRELMKKHCNGHEEELMELYKHVMVIKPAVCPNGEGPETVRSKSPKATRKSKSNKSGTMVTWHTEPLF